MVLNKIIVLLNYEQGKKGYLKFDSQKLCKKYFQNKENLEKHQGLISYEVYYAKFADRG